MKSAIYLLSLASVLIQSIHSAPMKITVVDLNENEIGAIFDGLSELSETNSHSDDSSSSYGGILSPSATHTPVNYIANAIASQAGSFVQPSAAFSSKSTAAKSNPDDDDEDDDDEDDDNPAIAYKSNPAIVYKSTTSRP